MKDEFWSTGTAAVLGGIISGAFTIALISLITSRATNVGQLISASSSGFTQVLKTAMGGGSTFQ